MNITITKNLVKKLSVMEHILCTIGKDEQLINGILVRSNGMMQAANRTLNMSFKLTSEELGLTPDLPSSDFVLPEMGYKFIKNLAVGTSVEITPNEANLITVVVDNGRKRKNKVEFSTQSANDYIEISKPDVSTMQRLNSGWFKNAISKCAYAISTNNATPIYTAAHLVAQNGKIVAYAIDGFKAAVISNSVDKAEKDFMLSIPQEVIKILSGVDFAETLVVGFNKNHTKAVFVTDETTSIQGSLYTGEPIMFNEFINKGEFSFSLSTKEFASVVRTICLLDTEKLSSPMRLTIRRDELVCSYANEKSRFEDSVSIDNSTFSAEEMCIGLNPDALLSTLKNCSGDKTDFRFSGPLNQIEVYSGDLSAIVVPMRISKEG